MLATMRRLEQLVAARLAVVQSDPAALVSSLLWHSVNILNTDQACQTRLSASAKPLLSRLAARKKRVSSLDVSRIYPEDIEMFDVRLSGEVSQKLEIIHLNLFSTRTSLLDRHNKSFLSDNELRPLYPSCSQFPPVFSPLNPR